MVKSVVELPEAVLGRTRAHEAVGLPHGPRSRHGIVGVDQPGDADDGTPWQLVESRGTVDLEEVAGPRRVEQQSATQGCFLTTESGNLFLLDPGRRITWNGISCLTPVRSASGRRFYQCRTQTVHTVARIPNGGKGESGGWIDRVNCGAFILQRNDPMRNRITSTDDCRLNRRQFAQAAAATIAAGGMSVSDMLSGVEAQEKDPKTKKIDNRLYFLTVDGTPYQRGYQHGRALRYVIRSGMARWKQWISEVLEQAHPEIEVAEFVQGTDFIAAIRKHTPDLYKELQGIAAGADVDFNNLYAYNMFDEFVSFTVSKYRLGFCTGFGVYGRAKAPNIIGQNNDLPRYFDGTQTLLRVKQPGGHETYVFTFAGLLANNGLNNAPVGCTINIMPGRLKGDLAGLPMPYLVRGILERRSRAEAVEFVKDVGKYAGPMNYIIGDPTGVSAVETGEGFFKVYESYKGQKFVPHSNHPLDLTPDMKPGELSKSPERLAKLEELIGGRVEQIDMNAARRIFRTRPILKNYQTDPTFPTLESVIMELNPGDPRIQIAPGPPDMYKYSVFDFKKGFVETEA